MRRMQQKIRRYFFKIICQVRKVLWKIERGHMDEERFRQALKHIVENVYEGPAIDKKHASQVWMCKFMDLVMDTDLTIGQIIHQTDYII